MKKLLTVSIGIALAWVAGCTTTTRPVNAASRETPERTNRTSAADRGSESRYSAPTSGPGLLDPK